MIEGIRISMGMAIPNNKNILITCLETNLRMPILFPPHSREQ